MVDMLLNPTKPIINICKILIVYQKKIFILKMKLLKSGDVFSVTVIIVEIESVIRIQCPWEQQESNCSSPSY